MRYLITSRASGREHLLDQPAYEKKSKTLGFKRKYAIVEMPERRIAKPIELQLPVEDKKKKRVEEPKTETND
jgi:hypothetical protein